MPEVRVPKDAWDGDSQGAVTNWFYNDGAQVPKGALLAEVMVDKATVEIVAAQAGKLSIVLPADSLVSLDGLLATLD